MKKTILSLLLVLVIALNTITVMASGTTFVENSDKTITVSYEAGAINAGKQYTIAVFKGQGAGVSKDDTSIVYINQVAADSTGKVTFESCGLLEHVNSSVFIGGETIDDPVLAGVVLDQNSVLLGDVNSDGQVTAADITVLMQKLAQWNVTISEKASDINKDGKVDVTDTTTLMQLLAGWTI